MNKPNRDLIISNFEKIFNHKAIEKDFNVFKKGKIDYFQLTLTEEGNKNKENTLNNIILRGFDDIYFVLKFDAAYFLHRFFDKTGNKISYSDSLLIDNSFYKVCDYIIWAKFNGKNILLLVELKTTEIDNRSIYLKFRNTNAFIAYLKSITDVDVITDIYNQFHPIKLLIHQKPGKLISDKNKYGYYNKGVNNRYVWYIKNDFEKIMEYEKLEI